MLIHHHMFTVFIIIRFQTKSIFLQGIESKQALDPNYLLSRSKDIYCVFCISMLKLLFSIIAGHQNIKYMKMLQIQDLKSYRLIFKQDNFQIQITHYILNSVI
ncbi:hypothetical protein FGO68_gene11431 [Halteria grandinella]|uniref:Transmembrane protein n=1 Tax=Halteria grandinella TaxID=5974 RepID=A0A8J8NEJ4_HALGN|nr:hypothetical protein FGO68_gene11431 [Halteria grandinella]